MNRKRLFILISLLFLAFVAGEFNTIKNAYYQYEANKLARAAQQLEQEKTIPTPSPVSTPEKVEVISISNDCWNKK